MRTYLLLGAAAFSLAACGGAGPESAGSVAAPPVGGSTEVGSFVKPNAAKTYEGLGSGHHYQYETRSDRNSQSAQLYAGDANTARDGGMSVSYDPRDAIFDVTINRPKGILSNSGRFQDPAHRTAFGGALEPQSGVPQLAASRQIQYLESGSSTGSIRAVAGGYDTASAPSGSSTRQTFFYQKPGTTTQYVTYGGLVKNTVSTVQVTEDSTDAAGNAVKNTYLKNSYAIDRTTLVYGERSDNNAVPRSGTATYTGDMLATMVYNNRLDVDPSTPTYFQWIEGSNRTIVDFGAQTVETKLTGTITAPTLDAYTSGAHSVLTGSTFDATGSAAIDLVGKGGFSGTFISATITGPGSTTADAIAIAGSSLDGAFYGPQGQEIGAGFRIVGGTPDERIDIHGVFTGRK